MNPLSFYQYLNFYLTCIGQSVDFNFKTLHMWIQLCFMNKAASIRGYSYALGKFTKVLFLLLSKSLQFTFLVLQCLFNHRVATYFCLSLERIYVRPGHRRAILNEVVFFWSSCSIAVVFRRTLTNFIGTPSDYWPLLVAVQSSDCQRKLGPSYMEKACPG